jgi:hypothetical protein
MFYISNLHLEIEGNIIILEWSGVEFRLTRLRVHAIILYA